MSLKFEAGRPVTVGFPSAEFEKVNGNFGPQYLYKVEVNGSKDKLYATEKLQQALLEAGVQSGSRLVILKEDRGNRTVWKVKQVEEPPSSPATQEGTKGPEKGASAPSEGSEALAGGLFGLIARCLREALKAYRWLGIDFTSDNIQATGNTLFIECNRRGIVLPPVPYPTQEQMEALARIGDAIVPEQKARLEKRVSEGITWAEAQAIIDYYEQNHKQARKAA